MAQRVKADEVRWSASASDAPLATIRPGEEIEVETLDCRAGSIRKASDLDKVMDASRINPVTGPLHVSGAVVGASLEVEVVAIRPSAVPLMLVRPGVSCLDFVDRPALIFPVLDGAAIQIDGASVRMRPMIGFVATSPAAGSLAGSSCGVTGGNLDMPYLGVGSRILLPVEVAGGGLYIGDVHLAQGDGELFLTGVEVGATVRLICRVQPEIQLPGPVVFSENYISILGSGDSLDQAATVAANRAVSMLTAEGRVDEYACGFILSAGANLAVCRFLPNYGSVCRVDVPYDIAEQLVPELVSAIHRDEE